MNYWHHYEKNNEHFLSDCHQLIHQYIQLYYLCMNSSVLSSGFTNFAYIFYLWKCCCNLSVYYTYIDYVNTYNTYLFCRTPSDGHIHLKLNGCFLIGCNLLQIVFYHKQVAVAAERIRCLGEETEQQKVCSPGFNLKYICICAKTILIAPET